jgi:hypothetical protein
MQSQTGAPFFSPIALKLTKSGILQRSQHPAGGFPQIKLEPLWTNTH